MRIDELNDAECREILSGVSMVRLRCSLDNQPFVIPVSIAYEETSSLSFQMLGQKIQWMRSNPQVCVQVDQI